MHIKATLLLLLSLCISKAKSQPKDVLNQANLKIYTGFYNVGTKPGKSRFMARIYIEKGRLMFSAPGGSDSQIKGYVGNHRFEGENKYKVQFEVNSTQADGFVLYRPREEWATDLYGDRNTKLDQFNDSEGLTLNNELATPHFKLRYTDADSTNVKSISQSLEQNYERIIKKFNVDDMPLVHVKVYPTYESYHLAVLTPNAPKWQKGLAWSSEDIRMVSPDAVDSSERQFALTDAAVHEFVHCIHMHLFNKVISPRWLWEGVALYVGCCNFYDTKDLQYLQEEEYPSLNRINRDPEKAYQLGYYLMEYIESKYGWNQVIALMKTGGDVKEVLKESVSKFEKGFYEFLELEYLNQ